MELELKSVVLFAGGSVFISVLLSLILAHGRWRQPGLTWLVASSAALLLAVVSLFARSFLGFEVTTALVVGGVFTGLVAAYFAVLAAQSRPLPWRFFLILGTMHTTGHAVLASFADTAVLLMLTSSMVNSFITAWMTVSVWKIVRPYGRRIAGLIAFPFAAISLGYTIRLAVLSLGADEAAASGSTIVIVTLMAWAAIILQIGAVALRERQASKHATEALRHAEEAAESKEQFLLGLSHEIRTPLNGLLGIAELLRIEALGPIPETYRPLISELQKSGLRLNQLLMDLLEIASPVGNIDEHDGAIIEVHALVAEVIEDPPTVEGACEIVIHSDAKWDPANPVCILGDAARLNRLLSALVENGLKFASSKVVISLQRDDDRILIAVEDDGPGMAPSKAAAALEMFDRGGRSGEPESGAGLGLTVASKISAAHGGELSLCRSDQLGGLRATFALPEIEIDADELLDAA